MKLFVLGMLCGLCVGILLVICVDYLSRRVEQRNASGEVKP